MEGLARYGDIENFVDRTTGAHTQTIEPTSEIYGITSSRDCFRRI